MSDIRDRAQRLLQPDLAGWVVSPDGPPYDDDSYHDVDGPHGGWVARCETPEVAEFIAAAPELVRGLLAALDATEAERDELHRDGQVLRRFRDNALAERDAAHVVIDAVRKWKSVNVNDNPDFTSLSEILRAAEWRAARPEVTP